MSDHRRFHLDAKAREVAAAAKSCGADPEWFARGAFLVLEAAYPTARGRRAEFIRAVLRHLKEGP